MTPINLQDMVIGLLERVINRHATNITEVIVVTVIIHLNTVGLELPGNRKSTGCYRGKIPLEVRMRHRGDLIEKKMILPKQKMQERKVQDTAIVIGDTVTATLH